MMKYEPKNPSRNNLSLLLDKAGKTDSLSIEDILNTLSGKGRALILIFLSLFFCQPIQLPGLSTPFGFIIALLGLRIAFGQKIWLPQILLSKRISSHNIQQLSQICLHLMNQLQRFIHPRIEWLCQNHWMNKINGLLIFFLGCLLALPLPIPFSNLAAGWSIFLISLGLIENDGIVVLTGYVTTCIALIFFAGILFSIKHLT